MLYNFFNVYLFYWIEILDSDKKKKKRKSRWGTEEKKTFIPGMPTTMPSNLTPDQQEAYVSKFFFSFIPVGRLVPFETILTIKVSKRHLHFLVC